MQEAWTLRLLCVYSGSPASNIHYRWRCPITKGRKTTQKFTNATERKDVIRLCPIRYSEHFHTVGPLSEIDVLTNGSQYVQLTQTVAVENLGYLSPGRRTAATFPPKDGVLENVSKTCKSCASSSSYGHGVKPTCSWFKRSAVFCTLTVAVLSGQQPF